MISLTFNKFPFLAGQSSIFRFTDFIDGFIQVTKDMKLVVQNGCLWRVLSCGIFKSLPHVHDTKSYPLGFLRAKPLEKRVHALFRPVKTAIPYRTLLLQVTNQNPIRMPFPNRQLINTDDLWAGCSKPFKLFPHVLFVETFDRFPVQMKLFGHIANGRCSTSPSNVYRKTFRIERVVGKKFKALLSHFPASPTIHAAHFHFQINPGVAA